MGKSSFHFDFEAYASIEELNETDRNLLQQAREVTPLAYAPYSQFWVGAVAQLSNGAIVKGTNQENASYPVGVCAERTLLGTAAAPATVVTPKASIKSVTLLQTTFVEEKG